MSRAKTTEADSFSLLNAAWNPTSSIICEKSCFSSFFCRWSCLHLSHCSSCHTCFQPSSSVILNMVQLLRALTVDCCSLVQQSTAQTKKGANYWLSLALVNLSCFYFHLVTCLCHFSSCHFLVFDSWMSRLSSQLESCVSENFLG